MGSSRSTENGTLQRLVIYPCGIKRAVQGHYTALTELSLTGGYREMVNLLQHPSVPTEQLEYIFFNNWTVDEPPESIMSLTSAMSRCRSLTHIVLLVDSQAYLLRIPPSTFRVSKHQQICNSDITWHAYSPGTFENILNVWPSLQELSLLLELFPQGVGPSRLQVADFSILAAWSINNSGKY